MPAGLRKGRGPCPAKFGAPLGVGGRLTFSTAFLVAYCYTAEPNLQRVNIFLHHPHGHLARGDHDA